MTDPATGGRRRVLTRWRKLMFAAIVFASIWIAIEAVARVGSGIGLGSFLQREVDLMNSAYPVEYDAELGWLPRRGFHGTQNVWHTEVNITGESLRSNGPHHGLLEGPRVLAVGDSFTFGDEVSDAESWPAQLEAMLHRPVCNAGVFGYGLDQAILRARRLVEHLHPEQVVLSFIPDDIARCELSVSGAAKPYFRLVGGTLQLENQPVPKPRPVPVDLFRKLAGYSWAAHAVFKRAAPRYWLQGRDWRESAHHDGDQVAKVLLRQFALELAQRHVLLAVVAQADSELLEADQRRAAEMLAALTDTGARCLDLHPELVALRARNPQAFTALYRGHMTAAGNRWVAEHIAALLRP